ncbi:mono-functional DNA-alkylating methyl methanesulfonate N-term-domain-containing protein [Xylaria bambusicola]|uniref:mono-functional DNA-alkylating methyl methanesulfonate N-term-domain-containing protein n=1 Tax=Xylaria bambusicola TaxID=326684 RepID=UPI002008283B|nr:mono-functional DNA-alkylating methyl methanesulfonate N-term-domain-containing protein [Xylaria bambusicola]KAI0515310.1 mono-functional DNA-alkylating methyl methanesulfonate N-term-domain-containing protein [Xylaria bambusicola]
MAYIAPIHRPNSVRHAIRLNLFPDEPECLVVAKANRLEVWKLEDTGALAHTDTQYVNGTISMLQRLRPRDADTDLLFVGTDRFQYFTVGWDQAKGRLDTIEMFYDMNEKHMRDSQSQDKCIVDPTGRFMVVLLWEGVINVLRMHTIKSKKQNLSWMDQVRISELFIKCASFLHVETGHPKIAFLYQTRTEHPDCHLVSYRLTANDNNTEVSRFETRDQIDRMEIEDPGSALLIPVSKGEEDHKRYLSRNAASARAQLGGLIVLGETRLLYYDDAAKKKVESALQEASIFVAWAEYDVSHYFVGDDYGHLWMLEILLDGVVVTGMEMRKIGTISRPSSLVYMGNSTLFVGSHYGDSQVFSVNIDQGTIKLIQTLHNIAPILDMTIMDMGNREGEGQTSNEYSSGQARIVTGSGVHKDGSLRSVRSGVGLDDIGILDSMENVRSLFSLTSYGAPKADTLIVSLLTESRIFLFGSAGDIEEVDNYKGMVLTEPTLLSQNLSHDRLLQVTPSGVLLIDLESGVATSTWRPAEGEITNVSANDQWILLSVDGRVLISLQIGQDLVKVEQNHLGDSDQVACVHLPPQYPSIGVVGFWKSGSISIIDVQTLQPLHGESLRRKDDNSSVPRDIALAQILPGDKAGPTLFVSMEDGFVITFNVSKEDFSLSGRKMIVLGMRHARLQLLPRANGLYNIFSTSEIPSLIYGSEGRIVYSAVTADDAVCICPFDAEAFPDSIVVATEREVKISTIDTMRRTHVNPLPMGETVRRIAYSRAERVFGLGCFQREVTDNEEVIISSFKLVDEVIFKQLGKAVILDSSPRVEMVEAVIRADLPDSYGGRAERFVVGTSYLDDGQIITSQNDKRGRILVLGIDSEREPYLITSRQLKGACRALAVMGDNIVAALAKTVIVYSYLEASTTSAELKKIASYRPATYPIDLVVEGNTIAVADLMKSMSLVEFTPAANGQPARLMEVSRHYQSFWATAICHVDGETWLESDTQGNLMMLRRNTSGATLEDQQRMDVISEINLGEMVNKMRKVTVDTSENAIIIPKAFVGTVEGGVYLFGTISDNNQDLLMRFQNKLADVVETTGNIEFSRYRSFRNEERESDGPFRFVDGELLEQFLDFDENQQREICEGLGPDAEAMRNMVEELKRMH